MYDIVLKSKSLSLGGKPLYMVLGGTQLCFLQQGGSYFFLSYKVAGQLGALYAKHLCGPGSSETFCV